MMHGQRNIKSEFMFAPLNTKNLTKLWCISVLREIQVFSNVTLCCWLLPEVSRNPSAFETSDSTERHIPTCQRNLIFSNTAVRTWSVTLSFILHCLHRYIIVSVTTDGQTCVHRTAQECGSPRVLSGDPCFVLSKFLDCTVIGTAHLSLLTL